MEKETVILPDSFLQRVRTQFKDETEYNEFVDSYENTRLFGLRRNALKVSKDDFEQKMPFSLRPVAWEALGYYYDYEERPGRHPFHEAGAYYIQEPSAMFAVSLLNPVPGDYVLDLCASPGGKSSQILSYLGGEGLLVSNEIVSDRARILSQNLERMGARNAMVTNMSSMQLSVRFPGYFDKILVDAPCSGEGMFRKDPTAISEWSPENVTMCAKRQAEILEEAYKMLRPGGTLVYSTCTFAPKEDELQAKHFLSLHADMTLIKDEHLWPHKIEGEGHYVAKFVKEGPANYIRVVTEPKQDKKKKSSASISMDSLVSFLKTDMKLTDNAVTALTKNRRIEVFGEHIYLTDIPLPALSGLTVVRPGLHVCDDKKNRLEPAHALAMALRPDDVKDCVDITIEQAEIYQHGETLTVSPDKKGWCVVFVNEISTGFGKATNGTLKNHYPKGLRR